MVTVLHAKPTLSPSTFNGIALNDSSCNQGNTNGLISGGHPGFWTIGFFVNEFEMTTGGEKWYEGTYKGNGEGECWQSAPLTSDQNGGSFTVPSVPGNGNT